MKIVRYKIPVRVTKAEPALQATISFASAQTIYASLEQQRQTIINSLGIPLQYLTTDHADLGRPYQPITIDYVDRIAR